MKNITFILGGAVIFSLTIICTIYLTPHTNNPNSTVKIGPTNSTNTHLNPHESHPIELFDKVEPQDQIQKSKTPATQADCQVDCKNALFESLLSKKSLSPEDINLLSSNMEYFVRYIRYNPEIVVRSGAFLSAVDVGDEGGDDYNEDLDNKVMLLDDILTQLPMNDLQLAANSTINSQDIVSRQAGLVFIKAAYLSIDDSKEDDVDSLQVKAKLAATINSFLYLETDPKTQLSAIQMLTKNSPDMVSDQATAILSNLSQHNSDPDIRGQAIELAALSAQPDSFVLTQIADELTQPTSAVHASALKALTLVHMRTSKENTAMLKRLEEFEGYLHNFVESAETESETADHAADLIEDFYTD